MSERDKLLTSTVPKEIYEKKNLESKIQSLLDDIDKELKDLEVELAAQKKKKGKYGDFKNKDEMYKLMVEKYQLLRSKLDGMEVDEKEIEDNRTNMEKLDALLKEKEGGGYQQERELFDEEKAKMEEWEQEKARQDQDLDDIGSMVKVLKKEVKDANKNIDDLGKTVKNVTKHTDQTNANLESQNKKLKELLDKIRSGDKICVDVILILVLLGLVAVLYGIIKNKLLK